MYGFTFVICTFVLCINCALCAPPASLLSAILAPSQPAASSASAPAREKQESTGLTTYDQKQSGKYNIHLNIKDVAIIALDAGRLDSGVGDFSEDYYEDYDLADFTVKPIFGLFDISTTEKPSSTTAEPPLIHSEPNESDSANETENATASEIEEPILKDPVNKTQSVVIIGSVPPSSSLSSSSALTATGSVPLSISQQAVSILGDNVSSNGIIVTTSTPSPDDLPPKPSLADSTNVQKPQKPIITPALFPTKPNEIPVQIILEQVPSNKQSSRQRPNNGNWHLRNRIRATPSHNRRITPPHDIDELPHSASHPAIGNNMYRKSSLNRQAQRNCARNQNGQCQNSNRRLSSPTLNGILNLFSFLSPQAMERLE